MGLRKTSHFGTLDPKVTGVLPIALNRACKLTGFFLGEDKEYVGIMNIHEDAPLKKIEQGIKEKFIGKIIQKPPVKSRVKREERQREVKNFGILEKGGKNILFKAEVEGGTYIRKLISDLGDYIKIGAHMLELRRIRAGIFLESNKEYPSINLYDLEKSVNEYKKGVDNFLRKIIIPGEIVAKIYQPVKIKKDNLKKIFTDKPIQITDLTNKKNAEIENGRTISVFSEDDEFVGMYKVVNNESIFAKAEFVLQPIK